MAQRYNSQVHLPSPSTVRWVSTRTIAYVLVFPSNSPYLTEYPRMTPLVTIGSLQLMLTLVSEITLYVSPITGSENGKNCTKQINTLCLVIYDNIIVNAHTCYSCSSVLSSSNWGHCSHSNFIVHSTPQLPVHMLSVCGFPCEMSCPIPRGQYPVVTFISCDSDITVWFIPCYSEGYSTITEFGGLYSKVGNLVRDYRCTRIKIISHAGYCFKGELAYFSEFGRTQHTQSKQCVFILL